MQAELDGFKVMTDQPVKYDEERSAPVSFDLFLVSIGTCACYLVKSFYDERKIDATGLNFIQEVI